MVMTNVFLHLFNMSITASWLALAVVLLRFCLKKAPKAITVVLWALVGVRLLCPFSVESVFSLIPSNETVPTDILYTHTPTIQSGIPAVNTIVNPILSETLTPSATDSVNPMQVVTSIACAVWLIGIAVMLGYTVFSYLRLHLQVREAAPMEQNVYLCDRIASPFILGIIKPRIYLPSEMNQADVPYVLAHESAHLKRRDHLWKPLGFLLLTVYWFNPVLWVAYVLLCRDIELACDEKVLATLGTDIKKPYSDALINCSAPRKLITACPLAFGESGVASRVKSVLHYKKPAFWVILIAVIASAVIAVCFLTDPITEVEGGKENESEESQTQSDTPSDEMSENEVSQPSEEDVLNVLEAQKTLAEDIKQKINVLLSRKFSYTPNWFDGTKEDCVRYYGTYGDCIVICSTDYPCQIDSWQLYSVADSSFFERRSLFLAVYRGDQLITLRDAYQDNLLTKDQIADIAKHHETFYKYLYNETHNEAIDRVLISFGE